MSDRQKYKTLYNNLKPALESLVDYLQTHYELLKDYLIKTNTNLLPTKDNQLFRVTHITETSLILLKQLILTADPGPLASYKTKYLKLLDIVRSFKDFNDNCFYETATELSAGSSLSETELACIKISLMANQALSNTAKTILAIY